ncbi:monothiol glutaredoxin-S10 [Trifolium repens]|jgi:glutaredoxin 3|nr:monothiol glutaredoxin-S10 [Trifolium repens]
MKSQIPSSKKHYTSFPIYNLIKEKLIIEFEVVMDRVKDLASKKAAVIFTKSSCYMCHSITQLFYELGASPAVHELDNEPYGREMERALRSLGCNPSVPAVFIGGKFVGSSKDVISLHVDGSLKQMLMAARAIWF